MRLRANKPNHINRIDDRNIHINRIDDRNIHINRIDDRNIHINRIDDRNIHIKRIDDRNIHVVFIKFDIYMSSLYYVSVVSMSAIASAISLLLTFLEEEGQES
jgi:hypothetical protein